MYIFIEYRFLIMIEWGSISLGRIASWGGEH